MASTPQYSNAARVDSALQPCRCLRARPRHIQELGHESHQRIAGAKVGDKFLSELTAEYPESLACSMADIFAPFVTAQGKQIASIADFANLLPETYVPQRLCDGAGANSYADHTFAKQSKLQPLADKWWEAMREAGVPEQVLRHLQDAKPEHPLSAELQEYIAKIAAETLLPTCSTEHALHISTGQPYRDKEIQAGHVATCADDRKAAAAHWPQGIAIGRLNIVLAEGRDPRLVLDSAVCKANTLCRIPAPSAHEVMRSFQRRDAYGNWIALALDIKAARKTVKVKPQEQGTLLFEVDEALRYYTVCHFGAKFSAYWWSRLGAMLTRIAHDCWPEIRAACG